MSYEKSFIMLIEISFLADLHNSITDWMYNMLILDRYCVQFTCHSGMLLVTVLFNDALILMEVANIYIKLENSAPNEI